MFDYVLCYLHSFRLNGNLYLRLEHRRVLSSLYSNNQKSITVIYYICLCLLVSACPAVQAIVDGAACKIELQRGSYDLGISIVGGADTPLVRSPSKLIKMLCMQLLIYI